MKNLLIFIAILLFSSCNNEFIKVNNKEEITTVNIQQIALKDSNLYKVVIIKNDLYYLNPKTQLVEGYIHNYEPRDNFFKLIIIVLIIITMITICFTD